MVDLFAGRRTGKGQAERLPGLGERLDQFIDQPVVVERCRGDPQPLRAARHGRVVDRLDVDAVDIQQPVARGLADFRITDKDRHDVGREAFVKRVWEWRKEYGGRIITQLKRLGASCDWDRERFTMDEGLSKAVKTVFVSLFKEGLIYKGNYIINWCPRCQTALSDLEVIHKEEQGALYYILYPFDDGKGHITVATTRPETMLGDTGVAVSPDDERYSDLVGKQVILPIMNKPIPIVGDEAIDPDFGTGALKVTPGHDPVDFEIGQRHGLAAERVADMTNSTRPLPTRWSMHTISSCCRAQSTHMFT